MRPRPWSGQVLAPGRAGPNVHLDRAKVGDKFLATYVESVAVSVEKAKKAPAKKAAPKKAPAVKGADKAIVPETK